MALGGRLCTLPPAALPMCMLVSAFAVVSMRAAFVLSQHRLQHAAVQHAGPAGWQAHTGVNTCEQASVGSAATTQLQSVSLDSHGNFRPSSIGL